MFALSEWNAEWVSECVFVCIKWLTEHHTHTHTHHSEWGHYSEWDALPTRRTGSALWAHGSSCLPSPLFMCVCSGWIKKALPSVCRAIMNISTSYRQRWDLTCRYADCYVSRQSWKGPEHVHSKYTIFRCTSVFSAHRKSSEYTMCWAPRQLCACAWNSI